MPPDHSFFVAQVLDVTSLWSTQPDKRMQVVAVRFKGTNGENFDVGRSQQP